MSRIRLAALLAVGAMSSLACASQGRPPTPRDLSSGGSTAVRVMSFNIRYGTAKDGENAWPHRRDLLFEVIRDFRPTVLGVQEALDFQVDQLADALRGYEVVGVGRDDGERAGEFAAILIDGSSLEVADEGTFWFSDTPGTPGSTSWGNRIPRICTWARLRDRRSDQHFYVYNVHWDHESQASRERSAAFLAARIASRAYPGDPVLAMGDFNAGESNPAFRALLGESGTGQSGTRLHDTFRDLHPEAKDVGTFNGFEGRRDGEKIDAILASGSWCTRSSAIVRTAREGRYPSDHFAVTAVVEGRDGNRC